jgi:hypothetical protein
MSERDNLSDLFNQALALPAAERHTFLDEACRDDELLRAEVESLLTLTAYKQAQDIATAVNDIRLLEACHRLAGSWFL